jgi:hypothetical protein
MEEEGVEENHFVILKKAGRRRRYFVGVEGGGGVMGQEEVRFLFLLYGTRVRTLVSSILTYRTALQKRGIHFRHWC